jgi:hypothetical protein
LYTQIDWLGQRGRLTRLRSDVEQIGQLHDLVFKYSDQLNLRSPRVSIDMVADYFNYSVLKTTSYEQHGVLLNFNPGLGGIIRVPEAEAINLVQKSDFVVVTLPDYPERLVYPFDIGMQEIRPKILEVCDTSFVLLQRFHIFDREAVLYVRPQVTVAGSSDGWVTSKGLTVTGSTRLIRERPRIEIRGKTNFAYLSKIPAVSAKLRRPDQAPKEVSSSFQRVSPSGEDYRIILDLESADLDGDVPLQVDVSFDTYFVPKDVGLSSDTRHLVVMAPRDIVLQQK